MKNKSLCWLCTKILSICFPVEGSENMITEVFSTSTRETFAVYFHKGILGEFSIWTVLFETLKVIFLLCIHYGCSNGWCFEAERQISCKFRTTSLGKITINTIKRTSISRNLAPGKKLNPPISPKWRMTCFVCMRIPETGQSTVYICNGLVM